MDAQHPLYGAIKRVERAEKHIADLKAIVAAFDNDCETQSPIKQYPDTKRIEILIGPWSVLPADMAIIAGEIIYNLRAALDYLVFELAKEDSNGVEQKGTQFLIEDCESCSCNQCAKTPRHGFDARKVTCLCGLSQAHIDAIEDLQPYKGVQWTKTLRDISNPDKHRKLIPTEGLWQSVVDVSFDPNGGDGTLDPLPAVEDIKLQTEFTMTIFFPDGTPVVETLDVLKGQIAATIDSFKGEFKV